MATIVAAAGGGNWTVGGTWVGGVAPTAADDAQLTVTSGNVTIDSGAVARSLDCTGYTGTLTHTAAVTLTLGDATAGAGNVALKLVAGMTYTLGAANSTISFFSSSATQQTITTAGKTLGNYNINGSGSSYILGDANTVGATSTVQLAAGTFNTGNFACSWGLFVISGATAKTLTLGSSAIAITGTTVNTVLVSGSNITTTANTAVMTLSGGSASSINGGAWNGMSLVFTNISAAQIINAVTGINNLTISNGAIKTGTLSFNGANFSMTGTLTATGNSTVNRILMNSNTAGTARTVTVGTAVSLSNVDFSDITAAGAAGTWTGTSMGNALGNSNITFDAPATQTRTGAGGNWSTAASWTSRVPLPQDNVIVGAAASGTLTADMPRMGADVDFTGFAGTAAFGAVASTLYGSVNLASGMTLTGGAGLTVAARSAKTITSNGKQFPSSLLVGATSTSSYVLADAVDVAPTWNFFVTAGTFNSANFNMAVPNFRLVGAPTVTLGTSVLTMASTAAAAIVDVASTATLSATSATFIIAAATANARTFLGGGKTYGTLTYTVAGSTGSLTITGSNTFQAINFSDATNARSLLFTAGTTTTVTNWNVNGTSGKLMTVDSATAAQHALVKAGGGVVSSDYLNVAHSDATPGTTWYAGANSVNGGNDSGWIFTAPPAGGGTARRALLGVGA